MGSLCIYPVNIMDNVRRRSLYRKEAMLKIGNMAGTWEEGLDVRHKSNRENQVMGFGFVLLMCKQPGKNRETRKIEYLRLRMCLFTIGNFSVISP